MSRRARRGRGRARDRNRTGSVPSWARRGRARGRITVVGPSCSHTQACRGDDGRDRTGDQSPVHTASHRDSLGSVVPVLGIGSRTVPGADRFPCGSHKARSATLPGSLAHRPFVKPDVLRPGCTRIARLLRGTWVTSTEVIHDGSSMSCGQRSEARGTGTIAIGGGRGTPGRARCAGSRDLTSHDAGRNYRRSTATSTRGDVTSTGGEVNAPACCPEGGIPGRSRNPCVIRHVEGA